MAIKKSQLADQRNIILLDHAKKRPINFAELKPRVVSNKTELQDLLHNVDKDSLWISYAADLTAAVLKQWQDPPNRLGNGLFLHRIDINSIAALFSVFRRFAFKADDVFLSSSELALALQAKHRENLFIGGVVSLNNETITFWRGDLRPLTVPFSAFKPSGLEIKPNFFDLDIIDCGQTVRLGQYEAATEAILYEYDPEFRRSLNKQRAMEDRSLGASLRRLRKQRGLRQEDFEPALSAKTIARIELGKVKRIQPKTLRCIAKRLSIKPEEIGTY